MAKPSTVFAIAATLMRRVLVDHARSHNADKRGSGDTMMALDDAVSFFEKKDLNLIALDDALNELAEMDPQQSKVVELRFFGGLSVEETAEALGFSPRQVKREWAVAKAWLHLQISKT